MTDRLQHDHLPLWKRCTVVAALLLSAGAITPITCFASYGHNHNHNSSYSHAKCRAVDGGDGGYAKGISGGGDAAGGGDCFFNGRKGGPGGDEGTHSYGANGGNVIFAN